MYTADLHVHSTYSDGLLAPSEILDWGIKKGLRALSITDHDSVSGIPDALSYSRDKNIEVIPGIELSTDYERVEVHILGYFIEYEDPGLNSFLKKLRNSRAERAEKMVKKLNSMGCNISFKDVCQSAGDASSIGRPHVARALVNYGYCKSTEEAFERYIGYGRSAYVERYKLSPFEAVKLIINSRGVPCMAHPGLIINIDKFKLLKKLKDWGLAAVEVYHTRHSSEEVNLFKEISDKLGLIPTGGTDCHGIIVNGEPLLGSVTVPYNTVNKLREYKYEKQNL